METLEGVCTDQYSTALVDAAPVDDVHNSMQISL